MLISMVHHYQNFFQLIKKPESDGSNLKPILKYDIQCMSIGFLTDEQTPMIWRGPMVTSTIKTFAQKVNWNNQNQMFFL